MTAMTGRLKLFFKAEPYREGRTGKILHKGLRLMSSVQFETKLGLTRPEPAIVDTGAPVSLIPGYIAGQIITKPLGKAMLQGVVPKQECAIPVTIAQIKLRLADFSSVTGLIDTIAYLADSDDVPLVLGFEDLLDQFDIFISYPKRTAYLQVAEGTV